jgi:hypothetical protein
VFVNQRQQGDIGEASAIQWLTSKGYAVAIPFGHSPHWDLVVEKEFVLSRIQVKTTTYSRGGRWIAAICTRGGNQSWSGMTKKFDASLCDFLFVHAGDGRRWMIPAEAVEACNAITLAGPKYSEWEVEPGQPIPKLVRLDLAA